MDNKNNIIKDNVKPILTIKQRIRYTSASQNFMKGMHDYLQRYLTQVKTMVDLKSVKEAYTKKYDQAANDYVKRFQQAEYRVEKERRPVKLYLGMFIAGGYLFYQIMKKKVPRVQQAIDKFVKMSLEFGKFTLNSVPKLISNFQKWYLKTYGHMLKIGQAISNMTSMLMTGVESVFGVTGYLMQGMWDLFSSDLWSDMLCDAAAAAFNVARQTSWGRVFGLLFSEAKRAKQIQSAAVGLSSVDLRLGQEMRRGQEQLGQILDSFGIMYHYDKNNRPQLNSSDEEYDVQYYDDEYYIDYQKATYVLKRDSNGNIIKKQIKKGVKVKRRDKDGKVIEERTVTQINLDERAKVGERQFMTQRGIFMNANTSEELRVELESIEKKYKARIHDMYSDFAKNSGSLFALGDSTQVVRANLQRMFGNKYQLSDQEYQLSGRTQELLVYYHNNQGEIIATHPNKKRVVSYHVRQGAKAKHIHTYKDKLMKPDKTGLLDLTIKLHQKYKSSKQENIQKINTQYAKIVVPIINKDRPEIYLSQVYNLFGVYQSYVFVDYVEQQFAMRASGIAYHERLAVSRLDMMLQQSMKNLQSMKKQDMGQIDRLHKLYNDYGIDFGRFIDEIIKILYKWQYEKTSFSKTDMLVWMKLQKMFQLYKTAAYIRNIKYKLRDAYQMMTYGTTKDNIYTFSKRVSNAALEHSVDSQGKDVIEKAYKQYDPKKNPQGIDKGYKNHSNGVATDIGAPQFYKSTSEENVQMIIRANTQLKMNKIIARQTRNLLLKQVYRKLLIIKYISEIYEGGFGKDGAKLQVLGNAENLEKMAEEGQTIINTMFEELKKVISQSSIISQTVAGSKGIIGSLVRW